MRQEQILGMDNELHDLHSRLRAAEREKIARGQEILKLQQRLRAKNLLLSSKNKALFELHSINDLQAAKAADLV